MQSRTRTWLGASDVKKEERQWSEISGKNWIQLEGRHFYSDDRNNHIFTENESMCISGYAFRDDLRLRDSTTFSKSFSHLSSQNSFSELLLFHLYLSKWVEAGNDDRLILLII